MGGFKERERNSGGWRIDSMIRLEVLEDEERFEECEGNGNGNVVGFGDG